MARKYSGNSQGSKIDKEKEKARGPSSDSQALRMKSIEEMMGIVALVFRLGIRQPMTPESSLRELIQVLKLLALILLEEMLQRKVCVMYLFYSSLRMI